MRLADAGAPRCTDAVLVQLEGHDLPGLRCGAYEGVHVGLQVGRHPHALVPGDAARASWTTQVTVLVRDGDLDVRGPAVHGPRGERFLYLTWGEVAADGTFTMFRRAKLMLDELGEGAAEATGALGTLGLTDACGLPLCARVVPPAITWTLSHEVPAGP